MEGPIFAEQWLWEKMMISLVTFSSSFLSFHPHLLADLSEVSERWGYFASSFFLWVNVVISGFFISVSVCVVSTPFCGSAGWQLHWVPIDCCWSAGTDFVSHGCHFVSHGWDIQSQIMELGGEERPLSPAHLPRHRWPSTQCHGLHRRKNGGNHCLCGSPLFVNVAPSCHWGKKTKRKLTNDLGPPKLSS